MNDRPRVPKASPISVALKRTVLIFIVLTVAGVSAASADVRRTEAAPRPNIIFVLTDDQDTNTLRYMPYVSNTFKESATTYPNATYNLPLCCPSRMSMLRGQYTHNHGIWDNLPPDGGYEGVKALGMQDRQVARWLKSADYQTAMFGKYINGYNPREDPKPLGWDRFVSAGYTYEEKVVAPGTHRDGVVKDNALRWLEESLPGGPLFMWVGFHAAHVPYDDYDPIYRDRFSTVRLPRPPSFNEGDISDKPQYVSDFPKLTGQDVAELTRDHRDRLRSLLTVDAGVREIVRKLEIAGELDNTYIVYWSDNGYMMGQHRLLYKRHAYVESISFPMLVRGPGVRRGATDPRVVMNQDLAPTFAHIGQASIPSFVDGRSMVPILDGEGSWRDVGLIEAPVAPRVTYQGLRAENYTYVRYSTGEHEYYDLKADPYQLRNAYASLDRARKSELDQRTDALVRCAGASCRANER